MSRLGSGNERGGGGRRLGKGEMEELGDGGDKDMGRKLGMGGRKQVWCWDREEEAYA